MRKVLPWSLVWTSVGSTFVFGLVSCVTSSVHTMRWYEYYGEFGVWETIIQWCGKSAFISGIICARPFLSVCWSGFDWLCNMGRQSVRGGLSWKAPKYWSVGLSGICGWTVYGGHSWKAPKCWLARLSDICGWIIRVMKETARTCWCLCRQSSRDGGLSMGSSLVKVI